MFVGDEHDVSRPLFQDHIRAEQNGRTCEASLLIAVERSTPTPMTHTD